MNTYQIARSSARFRVIETLPGKGTFEVSGFPTEAEAKVWLGIYLPSERPVAGLHIRTGE